MSVDSACPTEAAPLEGEACAHTPCYCEENVWRLIAQQPAPLRQHLWAVFISNPNKAVPLWQQRAGREAEEGFCLWDYHVIVVEAPHAGVPAARVWDLDTRLPFPCTLAQYAHGALKADQLELAPPYQRRYRVVPAADYFCHFTSDRRHMRREDGTWQAPPPPQPCIQPAGGSTHNLHVYWDVRMPGEVDDPGGGGEGAEHGAAEEGAPPLGMGPAVDPSGVGEGEEGWAVAVDPSGRSGKGVVMTEAALLQFFA